MSLWKKISLGVVIVILLLLGIAGRANQTRFCRTGRG